MCSSITQQKRMNVKPCILDGVYNIKKEIYMKMTPLCGKMIIA